MSVATQTPAGRVSIKPRALQNKPHRGDRHWVRGWSPEQISLRLKVDFPDDESMRISHEAIYQALYIEDRRALKRELVLCLRTGRALRVPRARAQSKAWAHVTAESMISERPEEADDRSVPGHWEGDLVRHEALAFPLAFKGRVVKYIGRILRSNDIETDVEVHDYLDPGPVFRKMHSKRLASYSLLGFDVPSRR